MWEMSWRQGQTAILTPVLPLNYSSTSFSSWLGLLNRGSLKAQSPLSATGSHFGILSPTDSDRLCTWLYYCLTPTCFHCSSAYLHRCISCLTAWSRVSINTPAVPCMSSSSYLDGLRDGKSAAIKLLFCRVLLPGFFQESIQHFCIIPI